MAASPCGWYLPITSPTVLADFLYGRLGCSPATVRSELAVLEETGYVFQPHGYGPTRMMKEGYIRAFSAGLRSTDRLVLLPIYYAGGTAARDISSRDIAEGVGASGRQAVAVEDRAEIFRMFGEWNAYVVFGARDDTLSDLAEEIAAKIR